MPRGGIRQGAGRKSKNQTEIKEIKAGNQKPAGVAQLVERGVANAAGSSPVAGSKRQALRDRLDAYKTEYLEAARRQDWPTCDRVNQDREPLFYELWEMEKGLPSEKRYWLPARVLNQGLQTAKK